MLDPEYINIISEKCFLNANKNDVLNTNTTNKSVSKRTKTNKNNENNENTDTIYVPKINEYQMILSGNYTANELKYLTKTYKLKVTGTKAQLVSRIYSFLYLSFNCVRIQKIFRGLIQRKYNKCHGPAFINRRLCTNDTDFYTMDELSELPKTQFFSFKDVDGFIYGFDLVSFHNLISKSNGQLRNPYNRLPITDKTVNDFNTLIRLSKLLKISVCIEIQDISSELSKAKNVELKTVSLFQSIDALGNYSNPKWFMDLNRIQLIKMLRELLDIWSYRAHLTNEVKQKICPPIGRPFPQIINIQYLQTTTDLDDVRKYILNILEKLVLSGIDNDSKCLGTYYVLGALTKVSTSAANALPWLYQAVQ